MEIVFATNNQHKLKEIQQMMGKQYNLLSLTDIGCYEEIPEDSNTIEENSMYKAEYVFNHFRKNCFADDTGLEVEALDGRPGVFSARYAGDEKDMEKNITKVLNELSEKQNRKARFKTVISLILEGEKYQFEGIINGHITKEKTGKSGFGYDPIFVPEGFSQTFAEMGANQKNNISHRGLAMNKLIGFLKGLKSAGLTKYDL
jgi:XTP/dITP diphosphohydrolase